MPIDDGESSQRFEGIADRARQARLIRDAVESVREIHEIHRPGPQAGDFVGVRRDEIAVILVASRTRWRPTSSKAGSVSIATTRRAISAICSVNHPSPEHRSTTSIPDLMPTLPSTPAGSGHSACHQPALGISVPWKNPLGFSVTGSVGSQLWTRLRVPPPVGPSLKFDYAPALIGTGNAALNAAIYRDASVCSACGDGHGVATGRMDACARRCPPGPAAAAAGPHRWSAQDPWR